tara:strand:- start:120 stop:704 length:585 start_codon:yes stop_codon:yes gene_type:complete
MEFKRLAGAILLSMLVLVLWMKFTPAEARNEYLTDGFRNCQYGSFDISIETTDDETDYRHYSPSNNYDNNFGRNSLRFSFRKNLGMSKKICDESNALQKENANLKQQLELMKMCSKVNRNPSMKQNPNFALLVSKCTGIVPMGAGDSEQRESGSLWEQEKQKYLDENPDKKVMDGKKLKIPKYLTDELPVPTDQ